MYSPYKLSLKFVLALAITTALHAEVTAPYLTPDVMRVGNRLSCRCGTCRNTVGDCPMLHCSYCSPKRQRIYEMKQQGMSDDTIVNTFIKEDGIVTLAAPPGNGVGPIITWLGPGVALFLGFLVYSWYVRRNQKDPAPLMPVEQAVLDRFHSQIEHELGDAPSKK